MILEKNSINVKGKNILDIGCGTGFYIEYWSKRKAASITGLDITEKSIMELQAFFPKFSFIRADISSKNKHKR